MNQAQHLCEFEYSVVCNRANMLKFRWDAGAHYSTGMVSLV